MRIFKTVQKFEVGEFSNWEKTLKVCGNENTSFLSSDKYGKKVYMNDYNMYGTFAFMCPNCFDVIYRKIYGMGEICTVLEDPDDQIKSEEDVINEYSLIDVYPIMDCDQCDSHENRVMIDPNIAESIRILNLKGFRTKFCCESHCYGSGISDAYVFFEDFKLMNIVLDVDLPFGWYIDLEAYRRKQFVIRADYNDEKDYLFELLEFAESLPALPIYFNM